MKNIKLLLVGLISSIFLLTTASADTIPNVSNYSPQRPGVTYVEGQQGFSYPSFDNFTGNPNISVGGRQGDERQFLVGKYCAGGVAGCPGGYYYNTLGDAVREGDVVRFEIYFHNNGEDPYDDGGTSSPDAKNVKIGVDLENIQDPSRTDMLRPKGFISADNNEYRTNVNDITTVIKDESGNPIRIVTDDMQILLSEYGLKLKPVQGSAWLTVLKAPGDFYDATITGPTDITFNTVNPSSFTVNVTPDYTENKMWMTFDKLPGCFRYSGFAYFDAVAVKDEEELRPPVTLPKFCGELKVDHPAHIYKDTLSWFRAEGYDTRGAKLGDDIKYWVEPGYGTFYTTNPGNLTMNSSATVIETEYLVRDFFNSGGATNVTDFAMSIANGTLWSQNQPFEDRPALQNPDVLHGLPDIGPIPLGGLGQGLIIDGAIPRTVQTQPLNLENIENRNKILDDTPAQFQTSPLTIDDTLNNNNFSQFTDPIRTPEFSNTELKRLLEETIIVPEGTKVYFFAKKAGVNVVHAKPVSYMERICKRDFSIEEIIKPVCGNTTLIAQNIKKPSEVATCIDGRGRYIFKTLFYRDAAKQNPIPDANVQAQWTSTDPEGIFYDVTSTQIGGPLDQAVEPGTKGTFIGKTTVIYQGGGQVTAKAYEIDGMPYTENVCIAQIDQCQNKCSTLRLTSQPSPIFTGQNATLYISPSTTQGTPLPSNVKINWSTNTGGKFTLQDGSREGSGMISTVGETPVRFKDALTAGTITAEVPATETYYAPACKESLEVQQVGIGQICEQLSAKLSFFTNLTDPSTFSNADRLEPNKIYQLEATATYRLPNPDSTVTYNINPGYGRFILLPSDTPPSLPPKKALVLAEINDLSKKMQNGTTQLTLDILNRIEERIVSFTGPILSTTAIVPNGTILYVATFNSVPELQTAALTCKATDSTEPACTKTFPGKGSAMSCKELKIVTPDRPWNITSSDTRQPFSIRVTTEPSGRESQFYYHWLTTNGKWEGVDLPEQTVLNKVANALIFNAGSTPSVKIWASEDPAGNKIYDSAGNQICFDSIDAYLESTPGGSSGGGGSSGPGSINPKITKGVYVTKKDPSKIKPLINISSGTPEQFLTFKSVFESGTTKSVEITEEKFKKIPNQTAYGIIGSQDGNLEFKEMRIDVVTSNNLSEYTILKTTNYYDDKEDEVNSTKYKTPDLENLEDYNQYKCPKNNQFTNSEVCIEGSIEEAVKNFSHGKAINFKNIPSNTKIIIKVQVKNKTAINTYTCKSLTVADGCGEDFENKISFEAKLKNGQEKTDYDIAKVVVICPYVLFRQGGDALFNSALKTGVDVGMCSPVKSSTGTGITPLILRGPKTPETGGAELTPVSLLNLPSHNVCRYSNTSNNIEGYRDALSNFSSTICEMKAEVADQWAEENINTAINANITRIARWGDNLTTKTSLSDMNDLKNISQSGVYVKTGNLSIGSTNGTFTIQAQEGVPAGQTYIIKNGDLIINSNIVYGATNYADPKQIPSAAFIVLNGNIIISPNVKQIDGVLMAVDTDDLNDDGQITSDGESYEMLTINGSMFGNVIDLFKNRLAAGDPTHDEGSVTIRYDERILLNTPPGLGELINVQQSVVPN